MFIHGRALHYVLKVANLKRNIEFFRDKLAMKVLRHEIFDEGCEAACNGPYANKWSKTMIGYGSEDDHFVLELTYNYSVGHYDLGNDLQHITISLAKDTYDKVVGHKEFRQSSTNNTLSLSSPDGYKFIVTKDETKFKSDISEVCLSCSSLEESKAYWIDLLRMQKVDEPVSNEIRLRYVGCQTVLRLRQLTGSVKHETAYGRIAFSCPANELKAIQDSIEAHKHRVLTPYISLDTPGKAVVQVVILADPDGHEICFVGDEGFRELSKIDPDANNLIERSMADDKSEEWFQKKGLSKVKLDEEEQLR